MKENYAYIDYLKLFLCFCVVGIHAEIFYNFDNIIDYTIFHAIFRIAVPFFFLCSGFFLGLKLYKTNDIKEKNNIINKYLKRLLVPYIFWMIIGSFKVFSLLEGSFIIKIFKLVRVAIFNPWTALWYVWAIIVFLLIYKVLLNVFKDKLNLNKLIIVSIFLYLFALLCNNYYFVVINTPLKSIIDLYMKIFITPRNALFVAPIFILMGFKIAKDGYLFKRISKKKSLIATLILFILLIVETILIKDLNFNDDRSLYILFILFIPSLFILFTKFKSQKDTKVIRNLSTGIYFMHCSSLNILRYFIYNNYLLYFINIALDILVLLILYKINNKYINKLIK
ncbi:MAG: acyltransferase [Bacilli bacterium]|nr:acyltransferase [Bacilli bacterium]